MPRERCDEILGWGMKTIAGHVLFRADGSAAVGLGHIKRCEILARNLLHRGVDVCFAVNDDPFVTQYLGDAGFHIRTLPHPCNTQEMLWATVDDVIAVRPDVACLDIIETGAEHVNAMRDAGVRVVCLDDLGAGATVADAQITIDAEVAPHPAHGRLLAGPEYAILPEELLGRRVNMQAEELSKPVIWIGFGGSDIRDMTPRVAQSLSAWNKDFQACVVLGPAVKKPELTHGAVRNDSRFSVHRDPRDLLRLMAGAHLAVCSVGQAMLELTGLGVPCLVVSLSGLHMRIADHFAAHGSIVHLGRYDTLSPELLREQCSRIVGNPQTWHAMHGAALETVDGRGTQRICDFICELLSFKR